MNYPLLILFLVLLTSCAGTKLSKEESTYQAKATQSNSITLNTEAVQPVSDSIITTSAHEHRHGSIKKESTGN